MYINNGRMIAATPKILPAVYNDALSYYEQLHILNGKLNEVISIFESYGSTMLVSANEYTDSQIAALNTSIQQQLANYQSTINYQIQQLQQQIEEELDNALEEFKTQANALIAKLNDEVNKFNLQFNELQVAINTLFDALGRTKVELRQEIQNEIESLKVYLDQQVASKIGTEIIVNNPYTKTLTNLNMALSDLYNITATQGSLTVDQYRELSLTADIYKLMYITANDYKYRAIWIFFKPLFLQDIDIEIMKLKAYINNQIAVLEKKQYMQSPFTGTQELIPNVIYKLAQLHFKTLTANEYKIMALTATDYADHKITAYEYIWDNPLLNI